MSVVNAPTAAIGIEELTSADYKYARHRHIARCGPRYAMNNGISATLTVAAGQKVLIQLDCPEAPAGEFAAIIDRARAKLSQLGVDFRVNLRS